MVTFLTLKLSEERSGSLPTTVTPEYARLTVSDQHWRRLLAVVATNMAGPNA